MELGLTIPLQRHLHRKALPYSTLEDKAACWDLHCITLQGRSCLLAVHCTSRYTFTLYDLSPLQWADLEATFYQGFTATCQAIGVTPPPPTTMDITKTHGRREVAYLNRAWDDVVALDYTLDTTTQTQPFLDYAVNTKPSTCAGFPGKASAMNRFIHP